jgi:hypothetical protein
LKKKNSSKNGLLEGYSEEKNYKDENKKKLQGVNPKMTYITGVKHG